MVLRILLIDDNPDDRLLAIRELKRVFAELIVEEIAEMSAYDRAIAAGNFDLVVTDYQLRWSDGITVLRAIKARYPATPVVMFTNSGDEEIAVEAMKAGLDDYVIKSPKHYFRLPLAVHSALKKARDLLALKAAETRYGELFERVPIGLYRITPSGQILEANAALVQMLGYADREALLQIKSLNLHMNAKTLQRLRLQIERDEVVGDFEAQLRTLDNRAIWVCHNARAIRNAEGICYYEGAIEDITDRKQVESERKALLAREQAARAAAEAASRMKDEFLAILSHELRTPLNSILGWSTLLRQRKFNPDTAERALEIIERNAKAQTQMIEDLLDISRIIRGKLRLSFHPVNLISVLDAAIDVVKPAAIAKAIELEFILDPSLSLDGEVGEWESGRVGDGESGRWGTRNPHEVRIRGEGEKGRVSDFSDEQLPTSLSPHPPITPSPNHRVTHLPLVLGDANRLQQIFWNLLTNAIKFTPNRGRVEVRLSICTPLPLTNYQLPTTTYAQIQVKDTGIGINPDFLPYVFDYFRQADSSSTRSQGGLGLGLAIVRQLVEMHGGTICAESPVEGQGATFTLELPLLKQADRESVRWGSRDGSRGTGEIPTSDERLSTSLTPSPLAGVKILVVEDENDTRDLMKVLLEQCGANVTAVSSAAEAKQAIALFESNQPDIIISDIAMPEEDGIELMRQLRAQGKQTPAIALTAYARDSDIQEAIAAGFSHHLSKPIEPDRLVTLVAELVGSQQKEL